MLISENFNANILAIAVLNFNMKTDSETLECELFNQHKTKSLYNIANYFEFLHRQILCYSANSRYSD